MTRRWLAPEVIQTSQMDCGPASLKCLLDGHGIPVSYGRLREACQTDVDGTSIDVMEDVAIQLGLEAEQVMVPLDHLLLSSSEVFPAILVTRLPDGNVHFVVAWRRHGGLVQVMDPGMGRRWMSASELLAQTHVHAMPIAAEAWREWAGSESFLACLEERLAAIGAGATARALLQRGTEDPSWRSLASLDAATRMVDALLRAKAVDRGAAASRMLAKAFEQACGEVASGAQTSIPAGYWSAGPCPPEEGVEQVMLRGAVVVKVHRRSGEALAETTGAPPPPLSPELAAALREEPQRPLREIARMLREDGLLTPVLVVGAVVVAAFGAAVEALVLRGFLDLGVRLASWEQRLVAVTALIGLLVLLLGVEAPLVSKALRMGRKLEARLRVAFLSKIPRLGDRYFHSRLTSDMAQRAHSIHAVRQLPVLGFHVLRHFSDLAITAAALVWLDPTSAPLVIGAAVVSVALPLVLQKATIEKDLRVRAYGGTLARFYLDALLGVVALRTHSAGRSLRREQDSVITEYARAFISLLRANVGIEALNAVLGVVVAAWLLAHYLGAGREPGALLLLVYWALNVPVIGSEFATTVRQYPAVRNFTLRLLEPLGALEEAQHAGDPLSEAARAGAGVAICFDGVTVRASGQTILQGVDARIAAGEHVAVVGSSGAGKSSLVGLLLGWHRAAEGEVRIDDRPLDGARLERLREETAWVDPTIQLWNRSMLANLSYGASKRGSLSNALEAAEVTQLLERLPEGLQTSLGDGGALVSGGEGQRVRLARAMLRSDSRLVVLDEPFRGLDREKRRLLLARSRKVWEKATLLCVTHDVGDTLEFARVLVVHEGHIVEDGPPRELAAREGSRFRALLDAEHAVQRGLWLGSEWRRLVLKEGKLEERAS